MKNHFYLKGLECSVKNDGFLAWTITTSNKSLQSSPTKYFIPLFLKNLNLREKKGKLNYLEKKVSPFDQASDSSHATYTKWKGLFVTRKSFLFAFTRRSKNFLISGISFMYSFTCSPTILCITGWLEPTAFYSKEYG